MDEQVKKRIEDMINAHKVFLFMKGTPDMPECGFSMKAAQILKELKVEFSSFNVFSDDSIREGIKDYSDWPTIPQLYISGKFIGGSDIMNQMFESRELQKLLE